MTKQFNRARRPVRLRQATVKRPNPHRTTEPTAFVERWTEMRLRDAEKFEREASPVVKELVERYEAVRAR